MQAVTFISRSTHPVPAVRGGAVEHLAEMIMDENESEKRLRITVITPKDSRIDRKGYSHSIIFQISVSPIAEAADKALFFYMDRIRKSWRAMFFRDFFSSRVYGNRVGRILRKTGADFIIVENDMTLLKYIHHAVGDETYRRKCIYYAHSCLVNEESAVSELSCCRAIFTTSSCVKEEYIRQNPALEKQQYVVIPNGIDLTEFSGAQAASKKSILNRYNIKEDEAVCLYSSRISPEKGVKELLEAFSAVKCRRKLALVIAGSSYGGIQGVSSYEAQVREFCRSRNLRVVFTGYLEHSQLSGVYGIADLLVIPSLVPEAGPLTALEAACAGIPVLAPEYGAVREYLGDYAVYFSGGKDIVQNIRAGIEAFFNDPDERHHGAFDTKFYSEKAYYQRFADAVDVL